MIRIYFDPQATQVVRDTVNPIDGQPDYFEGPGTGGEVTAKRWLFNPTHNMDRYEDIIITGYQDDAITDLKYALDDGNGNPLAWLDVVNLPNGDYATPYPVHVKVIFAPTSEPLRRTHVMHFVEAQKRFLKG